MSDTAGADYDKSTYVLSAKATMKLESGDLGLRVIYIPNADDDTDDPRSPRNQRSRQQVRTVAQLLRSCEHLRLGRRRNARIGIERTRYGGLGHTREPRNVMGAG